ncbi:MAG: FAD-dependent oxidoreductase [Thermofilaceae archaeon]
MQGVELSMRASVARVTPRYDVIVAGGGVAGVSAAVVASRMGVRVCLLEASGTLGGTVTQALVTPFMKWVSGGKPVVAGIFQEFLDRLAKLGGIDVRQPAIFEPELLKVVMLEMCKEAGVDVWFNATVVGTKVEGHSLKAVSVYTKRGLIEVEGSVFVDATGDADLAELAGAPISMGREEDGLVQPVTVMFKVGGINFTRFLEYLEHHPDELAPWVNVEHLRRAIERGEPFSFAGLYGLVREARVKGEFPEIPGIDYIAPLAAFPDKGYAVFNNTRVCGIDPLDSKQLARATLEAYRQALEIVRFLRKCVPGFEHCYLVQLSCRIGVRESRRIVGEHVIKLEELINCVEFPDTVARGCYAIDVHPLRPGEEAIFIPIPEGKSYTIPYRALIPLRVEGLLAAGRCISATHEALGAVRVIPTATATGQAAGVAAALSVIEGVKPRELDVSEIQQILLKQGAII